MARDAHAGGRPEDALAVLRDALASGYLPDSQVERAGDLGRRILTSAPNLATRVLLLGQCTTSWLRNTIVAAGLKVGLRLHVEDGPYDNVLQVLEVLPVQKPGGAPLLVLLPWNERLLAGGERSVEQRVAEEVALWKQTWDLARSKGVTRLVQVGFDWLGPGPMGYHLSTMHGDVSVVRKANEVLRKELPAGAFFVPLDALSGVEGRRSFYDDRSRFWTRQPFSERGLVMLGASIAAGVQALLSGPRKVLALDLDNTLWGGVVGEVGPQGLIVGGSPEGEAFLAFQRYLKSLAARGVVLAVCSKNNPEDAREPFRSNSEFALGLDDFAAFEANWNPKVESLRRIADTLRVGLDSFVFFDDNASEREHVRQAFPEVLVVDPPDDPSRFIRALEDSLAFESLALTTEDGLRQAQYVAEGQRRTAAERATSLEDFLRSLDMRGAVREINDTELPRVVQLLGKTNQFNLTTRRHSADDVRRLLAGAGAIGLTLRMRDRFGDHGLVGLVIAVPDGTSTESEHALRVDSLLLSCRVIGRTAEHLLVGRLIELARLRGYTTLVGEFAPTAKNVLVRDLWPRMGFVPATSNHLDDCGAVIERFSLQLAGAAIPTSFVEIDD
jgi:FkbH-like protein